LTVLKQALVCMSPVLGNSIWFHFACFSVKLQSKIWMSACRIWLFVNNFGAWKMQFGSLKSAWIFYFEFATNPGIQYAHSMSSFIESDHHVPGNLEEFDCSKKLLACYKTHTNWLCPFHWFSVWIRFCTSTGKFIQLENILWILSKLSVRIVCCKILKCDITLFVFKV